MRGADRRGEAGFGAERIAAGDEGEIVRAAAQLVDEVGDQIVEPAGFADQADERLARHGFWGGENRGFDPQHPFAPAGGGRQVGEFDVEAFVSAPSAAARRGGHRPYSRNVGRPENSRAAPSKTSRSNRRRAARPVIGAWRAASAGETQSWASRRSTIFWAGFERSLGATAIRVFERRARSAARSRAEAAASAIAPAAAFGQAGSPGLGRRPAPGDRRVGSRIFVCDQRHGPRPAQPDGDDDVEHPKGEDFGFGRWGVREGGEGQGGGLGGRRDRIALPCASLQARCEAVRVRHSQVEPRRCVEDPAWVEAGRPAGAVAPERQEVRRRAERVADGEAEVAQRGCVGVEAQDFGGGGGALQREAWSATPRRRAGRGAGRRRARRARRRRQTADRPPLPFRSPAPRPGSAPAAERLAFPGFSPRFGLARARFAERRRNALPKVRRRVGEQVEIGANHLGMVNRRRRFVTLCGEESAPLVVGWGCPIRLHYRT